MPLPLLVLFFVHGLVGVFPDTALTDWLIYEIDMPVATQATFYAVIFIPYSLKPIYGWISERLPICGRRRRPYVVLTSLVSAGAYLLLATVVKTVATAFAGNVLRTTANSFTELMLGALLVDTAGKNFANAGAIQALASGVRSLSSIVGLLLGLPLYDCASSSHSTSRARLVIGLTSIGSVLTAITAYWLHDPPVKPSHTTWFRSSSARLRAPHLDSSRAQAPWPGLVNPGDNSATQPALRMSSHLDQSAATCSYEPDSSDNADHGDADDGTETAGLLSASLSVSRSAALVDVQGVRVWASDDDNDDGDDDDGGSGDDDDDNGDHDFHSSTASSSQTDTSSGSGESAGGLGLAPAAPETFPIVELSIPAFLLLLTWVSVQTMLSNRNWWLMFAGVVVVDAALLGTIVAVKGTALFRRPRHGWLRAMRAVWPAVLLFLINAAPDAGNVLTNYYYHVWATCDMQHLSLISSASRVAASLVFFFAFNGYRGRRLLVLLAVSIAASSAINLMHLPITNRADSFNPSHWVLPYAYGCACVTSFANQLAFLPALVLATQSTALDKAGIMYAIYLSFIDIGDSANEWIMAPIVRSLGITSSNFSRLSTLLYIDAGCHIAVILFIPLVWFSMPPARKCTK